MKKFPLKKIKNYKEREKEKAEIELGNLLRKKEEQLNKIKEIEKQKELFEKQLKDIMEKAFNLQKVLLFQNYLKYYSDLLLNAKKELEQLEKKIEQQQVIIKEKTIDYKKFEKLEEIFIENKKEKEKYDEKKELDEIVSIRENKGVIYGFINCNQKQRKNQRVKKNV